MIPNSWTIIADRPPALTGSQTQALAQFVQSMAQVGGDTGSGQTVSTLMTPDATTSVLAAPGSGAV